MSQNLVLVTIT